MVRNDLGAACTVVVRHPTFKFASTNEKSVAVHMRTEPLPASQVQNNTVSNSVGAHRQGCINRGVSGGQV